MKKVKMLLLIILMLPLFLNGCIVDESDRITSEEQEKTIRQSVISVGLPNIVNFNEKRLAKQIYEMRDKQLITYTYTQNMNGKYIPLCKSIGYGLPYAAQYSNPDKPTRDGYGTVIKQADPNGLFMPDSAEATWINCIDPKTNQPKIVYSEQRLIISPFELK